MNLTNEKLITILSEKLGKDEDWVAKELARLVKEIQASVGKGETFSIEKFGVFKDKNGRLTFEADETFALEINYKYAGMSAIELKSPDSETEEEPETIRSTTEEPKSEPVEESAEETVDETPGEELPEKEKADISEEETKVSESVVEENSEETEKEEEQEPEGRSLEEILGISVSDETKEQDSAEEKIDVSKERVDKEKPSGIPEKKEKAKTPPPVRAAKRDIKGKKKAPAKKKSGTLITATILAMIVVVVGLVLFIIYINKPIVEQTVNSSPKQSTASHNGSVKKEAPDAKKPLTASAMPEKNTNSGNSMNESNTRQKSDVKVKNNIINDLSANSVYGLKGKIKPVVKDFYTIVVYSLLNENRADTQQKKLSTKGYRTIITEADVNNTHLWRVGIGQFQDVHQAEQAASGLPDPYLSHHFIKRVQIK